MESQSNLDSTNFLKGQNVYFCKKIRGKNIAAVYFGK